MVSSECSDKNECGKTLFLVQSGMEWCLFILDHSEKVSSSSLSTSLTGLICGAKLLQ